MREKQLVAKLKCLRCGHKWVSRQEEPPRMCPACHSMYWDRPVTEKWKRLQKKKKEAGVVDGVLPEKK